MVTIVKAISKNKKVECEITRDSGFHYKVRIIAPHIKQDVRSVGEVENMTLGEAFVCYKLFCKHNRIAKNG